MQNDKPTGQSNKTSKDEQYLTDHNYDGIKEFNNPLPGWWLVTFFGTIIFAFVYYVHYELGGGPSLNEELQMGLSRIKQMGVSHAPQVAKEAALTEEFIAQFESDPKNLTLGNQVYEGKCASCHGPQLQGLIGPNLTDEFWIHGQGTRLDIMKVISEGVADKGMPPWGPLLKKDEMLSLTALVHSKKGSSPPNPKLPQGQKAQN
jgi:cytochrome c oxidase cbb3-type subunit 3